MEYITQIFYIMVAYICLHLLETGMEKRKNNERMLGVLPPKTWNDLIIIGLVIYGAYLCAGFYNWAKVLSENSTSSFGLSHDGYYILNTIAIIAVSVFTFLIANGRDGIVDIIPFANKPLMFTKSKEEKIEHLKAQLKKVEGA